MIEMKKSRKVKILVICFVILLVICIFSAPVRKRVNLRSLENEVAHIAFPKNIEIIAMQSAIGDSGGNGNYTTLRVVLTVKTDLNAKELKETIEDMDLHFSRHYKSSNNIPIFYITPCENSKFQSPRAFTLSFDALAEISDYSNYFFIEFVE